MLEYSYYHLWDHWDEIKSLKEVPDNLKIFAAEEWEISAQWDIDFNIFNDKNVDIVFGTYDNSFYKKLDYFPQNVTVNCWPNYWCMHTKYQLKKENQYPVDCEIKNLFVSFNNQPWSHRCLMIDLFEKENILNKGKVTWHYPDVAYDWKYWHPTHLFLNDNYVETRNTYKQIPNEYFESLINIVAESTADCPFLTEKTWTAIFLEKPFLIVGAKGIHRYLQSLGIEMYDEIFDYEFDNYDTIEERIQGIIKNLKKLENLDFASLKEQTKEKARKNRLIAETISKDEHLMPDAIKEHFAYMENNLDKIRGIDHLWRSIKGV
jgi:hypothetical protein